MRPGHDGAVSEPPAASGGTGPGGEPPHHRGLVRILTLLALLAVTAIALAARYADLLHTHILPAEDPYTQVLFAREHAALGFFEPSTWLHMNRMYPVGLPGLLAAILATTGVDPIFVARVGGPILGALGVAGVFYVAWREIGPIAGVASGALLATAPEHVFRSALWMPTALDLALIPWFILALIGASRGARAWLVVLAVVGAAITLAHPWMIVVLVCAGVLYAGLHLLLVDKSRGAVRAAIPVVALLAGLAWFGLIDVTYQDTDKGIAHGAVVVAALATASAVVLVPFAFRKEGFAPHLASDRFGGITGLVAGGVLTAALLLVVVPLHAQAPIHVDYTHMLRPGLLIGGIVGFALVLAVRNPAALAAVSLAAVTVPVTLWDVMELSYLPHRTVVYVTIAAAILAGFAAQTLATAAQRLLERRPHALTRPLVAGVILLLLPVAAAHPFESQFSWYRLYEEGEHEGLMDAAERSNEYPLVVASWQANLIAKAYAEEPMNVHLREQYFEDDPVRTRTAADMRGPYYLLVDRYAERKSTFDGGVLDDRAYSLVWETETMRLYIHGAARTPGGGAS